MMILRSMIPEEFVPITYPGVQPNRYEVSNRGRIRSIKRDKIMTARSDKDGYQIIGLRTDEDDYRKGTFRIHRLVAWEFCEGYDESIGRIIPNHIDSDPSNNYFENLEWVTPKENSQYGFTKYGHHKGKRGEKCNFTKYNEKDIRKVCELAEKGKSRKYISEKTGIDKNYLGDILTRKKWRHVSREYDLPETRTVSFKGFSKDIQERILKLLRRGKKPKEICEKLNIEYNKHHKDAITNLRKKV